MKKLFYTTLIILSLMLPLTSIALSTSDLLPATGAGETNTQYINQLPRPAEPEVYARIVQIMLGVGTAGLLVSFTVAGLKMVAGRGNEEAYTKAKEHIIYAIIGIAVMAAAYAITIGITKLNLFGS